MGITEIKDEYLDIGQNMRTYINIRFAQLTIFIAITAGLFNALYGNNYIKKNEIMIGIKIGGAICSVLFFIMEERAADIYHHYKRRAIELEKLLGYSQYTTRIENKYLTATNSVRLLYIIIYVFWLYTYIFAV